MPHFETREQFCEAFRIDPKTNLFLSGTDRDKPLERWWSFGERNRRQSITALKDLGISLVTTPNYSLFIDRPRWDDLHAIMRIAIIHWEFISEGMPAALHVNGRTETDFDRWAEFIRERPEITHVAYEFTTGTGWGERRSQHAAWLARLARTSKRPLHLIIRGGSEVLQDLSDAYDSISIWDSSAFMKTMMRQKALTRKNGTLRWAPIATAPDEPLDILFAHNAKAMSAHLSRNSLKSVTIEAATGV